MKGENDSPTIVTLPPSDTAEPLMVTDELDRAELGILDSVLVAPEIVAEVNVKPVMVVTVAPELITVEPIVGAE